MISFEFMGVISHTCVEQFAVIHQECAVADDVPS